MDNETEVDKVLYSVLAGELILSVGLLGRVLYKLYRMGVLFI